MKINRKDMFRGMLVNRDVDIHFAEAGQAIEFNGKTYEATNTLAYFTFVLCHSIPTFNSWHFGMTTKTLARSFSSAIHQLIDIRHILAANDTKGRLTEDRIVGHIVDVQLPTADWVEKGLLTADLDPTDKMTEGMPLLVLGCLFKRAKGVTRILAEQRADGEMWATSVEILFPWTEAGFLVDGKMIASEDAPDDLYEGVRESWDKGALPKYRYNGHPVYLVGGCSDGEICIAGCALTTYPADSKADILSMAASLDALEDIGQLDAESRKSLPDSSFLYVERTGTKDADGRTTPDSARHCPVKNADGTTNLTWLRASLTHFKAVKPSTSTISTVELQRKLEKGLLALASSHFPDSDFVKEHNTTQSKGGENMDLIELLKSLKASLDELSQTDGFQTFKEAGGQVTAARNALYAVMDKCGEMVNAMAEDKAKTLAEAAVKEGYVSQADHDQALAEAKAGIEQAVEAAKKEWETAQAEKDAKATLIAERMDKIRAKKVDTIPDGLKSTIESMSADEEGTKAFDALVNRLDSRREACTKGGVVLSEKVEAHIVATLAESDEAFNATLDLWKSLSGGKVNASRDSKGPRFVPDQKTTGSEKKIVGVC